MSAVAIDTQRTTRREGAPLSRLTRVELRKMVDTRAGFWLLATTALLTLVAVGVRAFVGHSDEQSLQDIFFISAAPGAIVLPIVGILSVTSEWSQRTALSTFTLVPRRGRIAVGKVGAALVIAVASVVVSLAFSVLATAVSGAPGGWDLSATSVWYSLIAQCLAVLGGVAFGMLFLNSPLAIVMSFALPTVWGIVAELVHALNDAAMWLDQSRTLQPLSDTGTLSGTEWARLATSMAVWLVLPLAVGAWRLMRKEVA